MRPIMRSRQASHSYSWFDSSLNMHSMDAKCVSIFLFVILLVTFGFFPQTIEGQTIGIQVQQKKPATDHVTAKDVTDQYIVMAHCRYQDSLEASRALLKVISNFLEKPESESYERVKLAWIKAHTVYSHAEVFRFGNPNVDAWESKVNAWPMDEGLIDYVGPGYVFHEGNPHAKRNIIQKETIPITDEMIAEYQSGADPKAAPITSITDIESNVTTGFHAIEFLLWGQDTGTNPGQTGVRKYTDYLLDENGTNGFNRRRRNYLTAAARRLCADIQNMVIDWNPEGKLYSERFRQLPRKEQLKRIMLGMGSLCYAELAIERMRVSLITSDQEEEQSCFSDTTLLAIHHNAISIESLYLGKYEKIDGTKIEGPSISDLIRQSHPKLDSEIKEVFQETRKQTTQLLKAYQTGHYFDWMIREENSGGRQKIKQLISQLQLQATLLEKVQRQVLELAEKE